MRLRHQSLSSKEGRLLWDNAKGEFSNNKEANKWIKLIFRKGWGIKL